MKKRLLFFFVGLVCSLVAMGAEKTASFSLVSFTAGNPVSITSSDNTDVSLSIGRSGTSNISADSKSRGLRVQQGRFFTITVPEGSYITKVVFTSGSNGNPDGNGSVGVWSVTGQSSNWNLGGKAAAYTWTNGGTNFSSPMTFTQTASGDAYISGVTVSYDDIPHVDNVAPTIKTQPTNKTTVTGVATTLSVEAEGVPTPSYQWYSCDDASKTNAQKIEGATSSSYEFTSSVAGTYYFYVVASNDEGSATSDVVTVTVSQSYVITFSKDNEDIIGTINPAIRTNGDLKITTPKNNNALYLAGKTFTHWTDGVNNYLPNTEYALSSDVTVTPVFEDNKVSLDKLASPTTVQFIKSTSTAVTYQSSNKNAVVEQLTANGKTIDVALVIQNGKFDLQPAGPRAQTNQNTVVTIPVVDGAIVKIGIYDNNATKAHDCTINGEAVAPYLDGAATDNVRNMTYTYNGSATSIDYVVNASQMYATYIDVTYPGKFESTTPFSMKTAATGNVSIDASADHIALPDAANLTINGGSVTVSNGQTSAKNLVTKDGFAMTNGNTFFTVTLDEALKDGDVITAKMSATARGLKFATADGWSGDYPGEAADDVNFSYTVTAGDGICGETTFNVFRATANSTYFNNFTITRPATVLNVPVNATVGYGTFYSEVETRVPGNTKAYTATYNSDRSTVTLNEIESGIIPAMTPVVIDGEGGAFLYSNTGAAAIADNDLKGTLEDIATSSITEGTVFVLGYENEKAGFYRYDGATLAANKAYLVLPTNAAKINIVKEGEATGVNTVNAKAKNGVMYNLAGQRVNANVKGLVIVNGKVVNIK